LRYEIEKPRNPRGASYLFTFLEKKALEMSRGKNMNLRSDLSLGFGLWALDWIGEVSA
jgi:hypothetical protein